MFYTKVLVWSVQYSGLPEVSTHAPMLMENGFMSFSKLWFDKQTYLSASQQFAEALKKF